MKPEAKQIFWSFFGRYRGQVAVVVGASVLLNVVLFAGSLYLLLVYDTVLPSRSLPTLFGLFGMLLIVYVFHALFDSIRSSAMLETKFSKRNHIQIDLEERAAAATTDMINVQNQGEAG